MERNDFFQPGANSMKKRIEGKGTNRMREAFPHVPGTRDTGRAGAHGHAIFGKSPAARSGERSEGKGLRRPRTRRYFLREKETGKRPTRFEAGGGRKKRSIHHPLQQAEKTGGNFLRDLGQLGIYPKISD